MTERPMVTMVCTGNAARSVMAELLLRDRLGDDECECIVAAAQSVQRNRIKRPRYEGSALSDAAVIVAYTVDTVELPADTTAERKHDRADSFQIAIAKIEERGAAFRAWTILVLTAGFSRRGRGLSAAST